MKHPPGDPMTLGNMRKVWRGSRLYVLPSITTGCASSIDSDILSPYADDTWAITIFLDCATISKTLAKVSYSDEATGSVDDPRQLEAADGRVCECYCLSRPIQHRARRDAIIAQSGRQPKTCSPSDSDSNTGSATGLRWLPSTHQAR